MDTIERILVLVLLLIIIIGRTERTRRWWSALLLHTHTNSDPFEFKRRENLSPFLVGGILRERQNSNPKRRTRVRTRARFLSLSPSVPKPMENALENVHFESAKKRPLKEHTKGMHHRSSRLKREKKNRMNCSKTHAQLRSSFLLLSVPRSTSTRASRWGSGPARMGRRLCRCWQPCAN